MLLSSPLHTVGVSDFACHPYLESSFRSFEYSLSELLPLLSAIQCLLFLQHNNSHRVGAAASLVATAMVAGVTYI